MYDIKIKLLPINNTICFTDKYTTEKLIALWNETEKRIADIENMNLRTIIINTLNKRNLTIQGIND